MARGSYKAGGLANVHSYKDAAAFSWRDNEWKQILGKRLGIKSDIGGPSKLSLPRNTAGLFSHKEDNAVHIDVKSMIADKLAVEMPSRIMGHSHWAMGTSAGPGTATRMSLVSSEHLALHALKPYSAGFSF
jgi:hypothetical protein